MICGFGRALVPAAIVRLALKENHLSGLLFTIRCGTELGAWCRQRRRKLPSESVPERHSSRSRCRRGCMMLCSARRPDYFEDCAIGGTREHELGVL